MHAALMRVRLLPPLVAVLLVAVVSASRTALAQTPTPEPALIAGCSGNGSGFRARPPSAEEFRLSISTDRPAYAFGEAVELTLSVTNTSEFVVTLELGAPFADFSIHSKATGMEVWRRLRSSLFPGAVNYCTVLPGETLALSARWNQRTPYSDPTPDSQVPAGEDAVAGMLIYALAGNPSADSVSFTIDSRADVAGTGVVGGGAGSMTFTAYSLPPGCSTVIWTFSDGTPVDAILTALTPASALVGLWHFDAAHGRFLGWSPAEPAADELTTISRLEPVSICLRERATLLLPRS